MDHARIVAVPPPPAAWPSVAAMPGLGAGIVALAVIVRLALILWWPQTPFSDGA